MWHALQLDDEQEKDEDQQLMEELELLDDEFMKEDVFDYSLRGFKDCVIKISKNTRVTILFDTKNSEEYGFTSKRIEEMFEELDNVKYIKM